MIDIKRERNKYYLMTDDSWFIRENNGDIEKVCQIDDASSYYGEYDAGQLYTKCKLLGIQCQIVEFKVTYQSINVVNIKE